jgi:hypothetical protein
LQENPVLSREVMEARLSVEGARRRVLFIDEKLK